MPEIKQFYLQKGDDSNPFIQSDSLVSFGRMAYDPGSLKYILKRMWLNGEIKPSRNKPAPALNDYYALFDFAVDQDRILDLLGEEIAFGYYGNQPKQMYQLKIKQRTPDLLYDTVYYVEKIPQFVITVKCKEADKVGDLMNIYSLNRNFEKYEQGFYSDKKSGTIYFIRNNYLVITNIDGFFDRGVSDNCVSFPDDQLYGYWDYMKEGHFMWLPLNASFEKHKSKILQQKYLKSLELIGVFFEKNTVSYNLGLRFVNPDSGLNQLFYFLDELWAVE